MRAAVRQLISRLSGREVALYTFGDRAFRVADFTRDTTQLERKVDDVFPHADGESHVLDGIVEAAKDLARREPAVAMIIVVSAGSNDQSNRTPREVFEPVLASRSIVHVVESLPLRENRSSVSFVPLTTAPTSEPSRVNETRL